MKSGTEKYIFKRDYFEAEVVLQRRLTFDRDPFVIVFFSFICVIFDDAWEDLFHFTRHYSSIHLHLHLHLTIAAYT